MSNAPSKPVSFSRPKVGYFSNRPRTSLSMCDSHRILVQTPEGKIPVARPRHRQENNIKMDVNEVGLEGMDRIGTIVDSCSPISD